MAVVVEVVEEAGRSGLSVVEEEVEEAEERGEE